AACSGRSASRITRLVLPSSVDRAAIWRPSGESRGRRSTGSAAKSAVEILAGGAVDGLSAQAGTGLAPSASAARIHFSRMSPPNFGGDSLTAQEKKKSPAAAVPGGAFGFPADRS